MSKPMVAQIKDVLNGAAYLGSNGLADYCAAQNVMKAMRRRDPLNRLSGVREALNQYRVSAWLCDDGRIRLGKQGVDVLLLGTKKGGLTNA
jgi:hypothetical protein